MKYVLPIALILLLSACAPLPVHEGYEYCSHQGRLRECIAVPLASSTQDAQAKQFLPPEPGKGRIYLVRPYTHQPKVKSTVFLNDKAVAELGPRTYVAIDVEPGRQKLKVHTEADVSTAIDVSPGQTYYFQYQQDLLFFTVTEKLTMLDALKAQARVRQSRRAVAISM